jgi:L-threonylcarbamoyladenylate synthase
MGDQRALARVYALKGRPVERPSAVMYFSLDAAEPVLSKLGPRTFAAVERLLPGPVLAVLPGDEGIRIPSLVGALEPLGAVRAAVVQTSANLTGGPDARRLADVPEELRTGVDIVLDGGELPGIASTVVDLRRYESEGAWDVVREGALSLDELKIALRS